MTTDILTLREMNCIRDWYDHHYDHVMHMLRIYNDQAVHPAFPPTSEDLRHPELWKPASWKWFLQG